MKPLCPYCNFELKKYPARKTKCPSCGQDIFVKRRPSEEIKKMVRADEVPTIENEWRAYTIEKESEYFLQQYQISKEEFARRYDLLRQKFGGAPQLTDIEWMILNERLAVAKTYNERGSVYNSMASVMLKRNQDPFQIVQHAFQCELYRMKEAGVREVILSCSEDCPVKIENKVYSIDEAIRQMPVPTNQCCNKDRNCFAAYQMKI